MVIIKIIVEKVQLLCCICLFFYWLMTTRPPQQYPGSLHLSVLVVVAYLFNSNHSGLHNNIIKISYHLCSAHAQRKSSHEGAHEQVEVVQAHALLVTNECTVPLLARPLQLALSLVQFAVQVAFSLKVTMWKK